MRLLKAAKAYLENPTTSARAELRYAIESTEEAVDELSQLVENSWLMVLCHKDRAAEITPEATRTLLFFAGCEDCETSGKTCPRCGALPCP